MVLVVVMVYIVHTHTHTSHTRTCLPTPIHPSIINTSIITTANSNNKKLNRFEGQRLSNCDNNLTHSLTISFNPRVS